MSSSTTTALSRQPLTQVLRNMADPRDRRGVRYDLPTILSLAVTGVLAGCRSLEPDAPIVCQAPAFVEAGLWLELNKMAFWGSCCGIPGWRLRRVCYKIASCRST